MQQSALRSLTVSEYLESELVDEGRREFVNGEVYALSGGSVRHCKLAMNVTGIALPVAKRVGCDLLAQSVRVHVPARNSYYYPDIVATCESGLDDEYIVHKPCFIVEVLSPSTASIDRREKRLAYTTLETLTEYVLVYQNRMRVDVYRRIESGWDLAILNGPEQSVFITCLGCSLTLAQIYEGIRFPAAVSEAAAEALDDEWALDLRPWPGGALAGGTPAAR
jgi:Uma2 family endonuclease